MSRSVPIVGRKVTDVGGQYAIGISLGGDAFILIEDPIEGEVNGRPFRVDPRDGCPDLEKIASLLMGRTVESAGYDPGYTLRISFDQGVEMRVVPNGEGYDSWSVRYPPDRILIGNAAFK